MTLRSGSSKSPRTRNSDQPAQASLDAVERSIVVLAGLAALAVAAAIARSVFQSTDDPLLALLAPVFAFLAAAPLFASAADRRH